MRHINDVSTAELPITEIKCTSDNEHGHDIGGGGGGKSFVRLTGFRNRACDLKEIFLKMEGKWRSNDMIILDIRSGIYH